MTRRCDNPDDLIASLSQDLTPRKGTGLGVFVVAAMVVFLVIDIAVLEMWGLRGDMGHFVSMVKPGLFFFLAVLSLLVVFQLSHPGRGMTLLSKVLVGAVPLILIGAVLYSVMHEGVHESLAMVVRYGAMPGCFPAILLLGFIPLMGLLFWLRRRAPCQSILTGALAGVGSASLSATAYALHCSVDHPTFVTVWYGLAIIFMAAIGGLLARFMVRW